jgi:hypothetical protein
MKRLSYLLLLLGLAACKKHDHGSAPLSVTGFLPTSGLEGTLVTIYGRGFGPDTLTNVVTFNGTKAPIFQITDTSLVVLAPVGGSTGPVSVTVSGQKASPGTYTYQLLSIHAATPLNGPAGTNVTITGAGFIGKASLPVVTFNGRAAVVTAAGDTTLVVAVPDSAGVGPIAISVNGQSATGPVFTYQHIDRIAPLTGGAGTIVTIHGIGFGTDPSKLRVDFNGVVTPVVSVTGDTAIVVDAPSGVKTGPVSVTINNEKTVGTVFTMVAPPVITNVTPSSGLGGAVVVITGKNFSAIPAENVVTINGLAAVVKASSATQLTLTLPASASTGSLVVNVNQQAVTGPVFKVQVLNITAITPNNGLAGGTVTISGNGFDPGTLTNNLVFFNGLPATVTSAKDTQLVVTIPAGVSTGPISIQVGPLAAQGPVFAHAGVTTIVLFPGSSTSVNGIAADPNGNIYFSRSGSSAIHMVRPDGSLGVYAGDSTVTGGSATDGPIAGARFSGSIGHMRCDAQGNLYVSDNGNNCIREVTASGTVKTLVTNAGGASGFSAYNGMLYYGLYSYGGTSGVFQFNPSLSTYGFAFPGAQNQIAADMAMDANGNFYVVGEYSGGNMNVLNAAGTSLHNFGGFNNLQYDCQDPTTGFVLLDDNGNRAIYQIDYTTFTSTLLYQAHNAGLQPIDGTLDAAGFNRMQFLTVDYQGAIYVEDGYNASVGYSAIRKIILH